MWPSTIGLDPRGSPLARELAEPVKESSALEPAVRRRRWAKKTFSKGAFLVAGSFTCTYSAWVFWMAAGFISSGSLGPMTISSLKLRAIRAGQDPAPSWGGRGGWKSGQLVGDTNAGGTLPFHRRTPEAPTVSSASRETPSPTRQMQPESSP